ncbi:MAG: beta-propeller domain-containing protein [Candidatus Bathyarchaeota archaeon]|nr:beta-propeller domain-containing protein [Candidatus Termiticorpusculum sp.]
MMTQKEIKNKTKLYTIAAVLSALILVSAIYTVTTPAIMYGTLGISPMKHFNSIDELREYLVTNTLEIASPIVIDGLGDFWSRPAPAPSIAAYSISVTSGEATLGAGFSRTNIQVAGVDEADVVKTDGTYIYVVPSYPNIGVQIVNADPANPRVVGRIVFDDSGYIIGMYLSADGNKLAVLGSSGSSIVPLIFGEPETGGSDESISDEKSEIYWYTPQTFLYVYDVSNKANPVLTNNVTISGHYVNSRMVGNYIYLVTSEYAYTNDYAITLPRVNVNEATKSIEPTSIYYTDIQDKSFSYTIFNSINIMNDSEPPTSTTILTGASSCMYVSTNNMYVTFNKHESTELYRISFNGAKLTFKAQGTVPGYVLNQYSMDEYNNYFRIATTVSTGLWNNRIDYNNIYVLNMNLDTVGKIENLANGERIYSARFTGDKAYLVTFEQIDPFFVLDLKNPTAPKVAGELKIPGVSNYLHPYNENYIIGLGQEDNAVKLSLFDVTDMNNPIEIAKYLITEDDAWLYSEAQYEPKAFLFDLYRQLLVIPVTINHNGYWELIDDPEQPALPEPTPTPKIAPRTDSSDSSKSSADSPYMMISPGIWHEGKYWSGVYVFNVSLENGFTLQKAISHKPAGNNEWWYGSVARSLYIGNTLYTVSNDMIQLTSLDDYRVIAQVIF